MCIIAIKKKELPLWNKDTIQTMFENNPDGAGIMWVENKQVEFKKGFKKVDELIKFIDSKKEILSKTDVALHFRIATSGKKDELTCHPYPVFENNTKLEGHTDLAMMHNGVLDSYGWVGNKDINDTQVFIQDLKKLPRNFLKNKTITFLISKAIGYNRLCFLDKNGFTTFGKWFEDKEYVYSNESYKPKQPQVVTFYKPVNYPSHKASNNYSWDIKQNLTKKHLDRTTIDSVTKTIFGFNELTIHFDSKEYMKVKNFLNNNLNVIGTDDDITSYYDDISLYEMNNKENTGTRYLTDYEDDCLCEEQTALF